MTAEVDRPSEPRRSRNPTVSWFELFYDLVVVAAVSLTNDAFLDDPGVTTARAAALGIISLSWVWFLTTLFNNMFPGRDLVRRLLMLLQMGLITIAALSIDRGMGVDSHAALLAYAGALAVIVVLIVTDRAVTGGRRAAASSGGVSVVALLIAAALCVAGSFAQPELSAAFLAAALLVSMVPTLTWQYHRWMGDSRLRLDHLRERLGLFILIILGEGFAQLVAALHSVDGIPRTSVFALTFLVSFALWWIYFDGTFSEQLDLGRVRWRLSLLGHLTLVFGMAGTLDILVVATAQLEAEFGRVIIVYFAASIATVLFSFTLLRFAAKGRIGRAGVVHLASGVVLLGIGVQQSHGSTAVGSAFITLCAVAVVANGLVAAWTDRGERRGGLRAQFTAVIRGSDDDIRLP